jgi:hypothetical protein
MVVLHLLEVEMNGTLDLEGCKLENEAVQNGDRKKKGEILSIYQKMEKSFAKHG